MTVEAKMDVTIEKMVVTVTSVMVIMFVVMINLALAHLTFLNNGLISLAFW